MVEMSIPTMVIGVLGYSMSDIDKMYNSFKIQFMDWEKIKSYPFDLFEELRESIEKDFINNKKSPVYKQFRELTPELQIKFWEIMEYYFDKFESEFSKEEQENGK